MKHSFPGGFELTNPAQEVIVFSRIAHCFNLLNLSEPTDPALPVQAI